MIPICRFTVDGLPAVLLGCPACGMETPHKVSEAGKVCGICGRVQGRG